jgi:hypothetical protein
MQPEDIRLELFVRRKKTSMSKIARSLDPPVTRQSVSLVIDRKSVSNRIMEAIADAIERDKKYVFPEYFLKKDVR